MSEQKSYPIGIQSFPKIREEGYLYVDKTAFLYPLVEKGGYFFLSRPRRFGKSLMLSTLEAYYMGRRNLFKGLALDFLTEDWEPHPVLHLDLNVREYRDRESLVAHLRLHLENWEKRYDCVRSDRSPEERFGNVIRKAFEKTGKRVAILIDEYDKPLLSAIENEALADQYRSLLKAFYSNLKSMDDYIEIAVLTGVARFSKISIFSDLNNLRDISFEDRFASICGITSEELDHYFSAGIEDLAEKMSKTPQEVRGMLGKKYDGYHFAKESPDIYNPFSLINVFAKMDMGAYWSSYATPIFLARLLKNEQWILHDLTPVEIDADYLEGAGLLTTDPIPPLYQAGYLTIKEYDPLFRSYTLDYPNEEVRYSFLTFLLPSYIDQASAKGRFFIKKFITAVDSGGIDEFMKQLESMLAGVPYSEKGSPEAHFQNVCFLLFTLMGQFVKVEDRTSDGRIDMTVETARYIYIFEFKVNSTPQDALEQIHRKKYQLKFLGCGKHIYLVGANFDTHTRRLSGYCHEAL